MGLTEAMDDDLNVSAAWGAVFDWVRDTNRKLVANDLTAETAATELANWEHINSVLGIESTEEEAPPEIAARAEETPPAPQPTNFPPPDHLRVKDERGVLIPVPVRVLDDTVRGRIHSNQTFNTHFQSGFFHQFPHTTLNGTFSGVHSATGQTPQSIVGAAGEKHLLPRII